MLGVGLEVASCACYVLMFGPVFCERMALRTSVEIGLAELGVGSLIPAGGLGGLALGVWALRRGGMPIDQVATRSVAFFLIKCAANFAAVAVVGVVMWLGIGTPPLSPALTILPAVLALAVIAVVASLPIFLARAKGDGRAARAARTLGRGVSEALRLLRTGNPAIVLGSLGYWAFDNLVLWACFDAFGVHPPLTVVLMGYLIGQLGGLLPIPGGLGGVEGGLVGTLVVYGVSVQRRRRRGPRLPRHPVLDPAAAVAARLRQPAARAQPPRAPGPLRSADLGLSGSAGDERSGRPKRCVTNEPVRGR